MKKHLAIFLAASLAAFDGLLALDGGQAVERGAWIESFAAATNLAAQTSTPLVFVFANKNCPECAKLEDAIDSAEFQNWMAGDGAGYVYCFIRAVMTKETGVNKNSGAKTFVRSAAGTIADEDDYLNAYPYVCLWWPKADGSFEVENFTGRATTMPVSYAGRTLAGQFIASIENFTAAYKATLVDAFDFACGAGAGERLEIEPGAKTLPLVFTRSGPWCATGVVVRLSIDWPGGDRTIETVSFARNATRASCDVSVEDRWMEGASIVLSAMGRSREVACVDTVANSVANPYAPGEKAPEKLAFSDWTLDAAAARANLASGRADALIAFYSGVMWCPYCKGMETSLLNSPEFSQFLEDSRVQTALYDQARSAASGGGCQLLTLDPGSTETSGAGYLSRHGLSGEEAAVKAVLAETVFNSTNLWLAPEATAARLSTPTMLLIGKNNQVLGRFAAWRDREGVFGSDTRYYDPAENIARLEDFLLLAGRADESSDYASTTRRVHEIGSSSEAAFQINDRVECFIVRPEECGTLHLNVYDAREDVSIEWVRDGAAVASGAGTLDVSVTEEDLAAKRLAVRLSAYPDYLTRRIAGSSSVFTARLSSSFTPAPTSYLGKKTDARVVLANADGEIAGVATVKIAKSGRATVKLETADGKTTFSGKLDSSGAATLVKKGVELKLAIGAFGSLSVSCGEIAGETAISGQSVDFTPYQGYYTIAMPSPDGAAGAGSITLSISANGKAKAKVILPDGKAFSATVQPAFTGSAYNGVFVWPVFKRTAKYSFAAAIEVSPNGAALWRDTESLRLVEMPGGAVWNGQALDLFGGWYEKGVSEAEFRDIFELPAERTITIDGRAVDAKLRINAKTGLFTGSAKIDGVSGKIKGVLTPGWTDCGCAEDLTERPFGAGTFYWRENGATHSAEINLN